MWKDYLGYDALIVGIDIDPQCKSYEEEGIKICIGSQSDPEFLKTIAKKYGPFDIVLDDGSHQMEHQITSFEVLFPEVKDGGIYLCEDTHTSYFSEYNGILHGKDDEIKACHYYSSMVVLEKSIEKKSISSVLGKKFMEANEKM